MAESSDRAQFGQDTPIGMAFGEAVEAVKLLRGAGVRSARLVKPLGWRNTRFVVEVASTMPGIWIPLYSIVECRQVARANGHLPLGSQPRPRSRREIERQAGQLSLLDDVRLGSWWMGVN